MKMIEFFHPIIYKNVLFKKSTITHMINPYNSMKLTGV